MLLLFNTHTHAGGDCHTHITDSEPAELWNFFYWLDNHRLCWFDGNDCCISGLKEGRVFFLYLPGLRVQLLVKLDQLACDLGSVGVENRSVSGSDCGWVLQNDNLSYKRISYFWWIVNMFLISLFT